METIITCLKWDLAAACGINLVLWAWVWAVPPRLVWVRHLFGGAQGLALPGLILIPERFRTDETDGTGESQRTDCPDRAEVILRHELVHRDQMRRYSPLGTAILLGWHYAAGFLRHRGRVSFLSLYLANPLELEAFRGQNRRDPLPRVLGWRD